MVRRRALSRDSGTPQDPVPNPAALRLSYMGKLFSFIGATIGSYAGWALGEKFGFTTAFMLSMVGTGFGIYFGRRLAKNYIE
jgi:hypothetical protein